MQLYQDKQKVAEHIAAEGGKDAVERVGYKSLYQLLRLPCACSCN